MDLIRYDPCGQRLLFPIAGFNRRRQATSPPAHRDVDTSQAAAAQASPKTPRRRELILSIIRGQAARGCTIDELVLATGLLTQSVCPVVAALKRDGLIIDSGQRRPTRTNSPAKVWVTTED